MKNWTNPNISHWWSRCGRLIYNQIILRKLLLIITFLLHKKEHQSMLIQKIINSINIKGFRPYWVLSVPTELVYFFFDGGLVC